MARAVISATVRPAVFAGFVDGEDGLDELGLAHEAHDHFGDQHHGAFAAGEQAGEIVARQVGRFAAGFDDGAIGEDHFQSQDVIGGDAVGQGVGSAGIFGDVAADGAGALAGGIGRIEIAAALDRQRDIEIDHAGLHYRALVFEIDFEDAVHAGEGDHEAAFARNRAAGESGAGAASHEGHVEFPRQFDQCGDFGGATREDDQVGRVLIDAAIVFVERQVLRPIEIAARTE